jgi:FtsH-binding integral membrane protein
MYDEEETRWDEVVKEPWELRLGFIRKVYGILLAQLLFTSGIVLIIFNVQAIQEYLVDNLWPLLVCAIVSLCTLICLFCFKRLARQVPTNYILLGVFTLCEAVLVGICCSFYDSLTVLIAVAMTLQVTLVLTIYAMTTKTDFTTFRGVMLVIFITVIMLSLMMSLFYASHWLQILISAILCVVYGVYIIIDTQWIIGNHKYSIGYDDYVLGAVSLYIDIVGLLLAILSLFGKSNK